jgi:hypothetical protein
MKQDNLNEAIEYLRSRKKYIVDLGCKFVPTKAVMTYVAETMRKYRQEVELVSPVQLVKGRKK